MVAATVDLQTAEIGTAHPLATCSWCGLSLEVGQIYNLRCWVCPVDWQRQVALALKVTDKTTGVRVLNVPLPSQALFEECPARNVLWGGQAGPGKSHGVRHWLYARSMRVPGHEALLLRENWEQLDKTHLRKMEREVPLLGGKFWKGDRKVEFGSGSTASIIDCGHMADVDAVGRYLSTEYGAIVPDEASLYPVDSEGVTPLAELSTRARKVYRDRNEVEVRPRFIPVTNPGGPSAPWLRDMFKDHTPDFEKYPKLRERYDPAQWVYIPAKLSDNPYQDPEYGDTLAVLSKVRYQQLAEGDWDAFAGAFFSEWMATRDQQPWHAREFLA